MNRGWIVELEPGVYKADGVGRTLLLDSAKRYGTISAATHGLAVMRSMGPNFINAKIYHDDHIKAPAQDDGKPESETTNRLLECSVCGDLEGAPYEQGDTCTMCGVGVYRTKPTPARDIPGEVWDMLVDHLPAKGRTKLYDKMRAYFGAVTGKEPVRGDVQP